MAAMEVRLSDPVARLAASLTDIAGVPVELERPGDAEHGDYATNVALKLAGLQKRPPREIADEIAAKAVADGLAERAESAGPGFVNLWLADAWLAGRSFARSWRPERAFGAGSASKPERIQVEMVSANPTGPITVAHARNAAYGDSVARLLELAGHDVEREYYYNDAGAQMERFYASIEALRRGEEPPEDGYRGAYMDELAALPGDPVPPMLAKMEASLERFRIHFDSWTRETEVEAEIPEAVALLDTYEEDGAVWARTTNHGDDKDRVLVRSDGAPTYFAKDAAYMRRKFARGHDRLVYVLGADHHGYVARLQALAEMLGHRARARSRCSSTSSSSSSRAARRRRCPSGAATSSSSTSSSTRSASTPRAGTSSRAGTTRRSSSTSTSRPSARRRTLSITSSTRTLVSLESSETPALRVRPGVRSRT